MAVVVSKVYLRCLHVRAEKTLQVPMCFANVHVYDMFVLNLVETQSEDK